eukprot:13689324-Alexandrium_andersonii.AAC.1
MQCARATEASPLRNGLTGLFVDYVAWPKEADKAKGSSALRVGMAELLVHESLVIAGMGPD